MQLSHFCTSLDGRWLRTTLEKLLDGTRSNRSRASSGQGHAFGIGEVVPSPRSEANFPAARNSIAARLLATESTTRREVRVRSVHQRPVCIGRILMVIDLVNRTAMRCPAAIQVVIDIADYRTRRCGGADVTTHAIVGRSNTLKFVSRNLYGPSAAMVVGPRTIQVFVDPQTRLRGRDRIPGTPPLPSSSRRLAGVGIVSTRFRHSAGVGSH